MFVKMFAVPTVLFAALVAPPHAGWAAHEKGPGPVRVQPAAGVDQDGDPLPAGALVRLGTTRFRHGSMTANVAFSPDGKTIASTGYGSGLILWDTGTGKPRLRLPLLQRSYFTLAFSPDGKMLALNNVWDTSFRGLVFLDSATGKEISRLTDGMDRISLAFSPDGKTLAGGMADNTIGIWDVGTSKELRRLTSDSTADVLAFSPDGTILASGHYDKTVHLWDPKTGKELAKLKGHKHSMSSIAFSPDGSLLASASWDIDDHGPALLWDVATRRQVRAIGKTASPVYVTFSPLANELASGNQDGSVSFWDLASGRELRRFQAHQRSIVSMAFSRDGKTLASAASSESAIRLWDVATGKEKCGFAGHQGAVEFVAFAPGNQTLMSVARDQTVRTWDWSSANQREVRLWPSPSWRMFRFVVSQNGKTLAAEHHRKDRPTIVVSDLATRKELAKLENGKFVGSVALSPQGDTLAVGNDERIQIWNVATQKEQYRLPGSASRFGLAFSPNGTKLVSGFAGTGATKGPRLRLWDVRSGKELGGFTPYPHSGKMAFSADGKTLITTSFVDSDPARLWDVAERRERYPLADSGPVEAVAFSPDARLVALAGGWISILMGSDESVRVWETMTAKEVLRFAGHPGGTTSLAFTADSRALASGGGDGSILIWDICGQGNQPAKPLAEKELEQCWIDLAGADAAKAYRAIWKLAGAPEQSVPFLKKRLRPVVPPDPEQLHRLIADLGSNRFAVREKAYHELKEQAELAAPGLRKAAADKLPLETHRRVDQLLKQLRQPIARPDDLQRIRAVAVLEYVGSAGARDCLRALAGGALEARLTKQAQESLARLER